MGELSPPNPTADVALPDVLGPLDWPADAVSLDAWRLAYAFLLGYRGHTRRAYSNDVRHWYGWCAARRLDPLAAHRYDADAYATELTTQPLATTGRRAAATTVARRLWTLLGLYGYAVDEGLLARNPFGRVARPTTANDSTSTGLTRDELRQLLAVARQHSTRAHALLTLLALNGLRINEALSRNVEHLAVERGHTVLHLDRKGGKRAVAPLAAPTVRVLHEHLAGREEGAIFTTRTGNRMDEPAAWRLLRRLAAKAELAGAQKINPHSLRHTFVTAALDAGVPLRDVQDAAGHADPRTTRRYDRSRHNLDRHATYAVAAFVSDDEPPPSHP